MLVHFARHGAKSGIFCLLRQDDALPSVSWYAERDHLASFKSNIYRGTSIGHRKPHGQLLINAVTGKVDFQVTGNATYQELTQLRSLESR